MIVTQFEYIEYEVVNGIGIIRLNKINTLNAMDDSLKKDLNDVMDLIKDDNHVKVVILTGNGKAFSAGGDINSLEKVSSLYQGRDRIKKLQLLLKKFLTLEKPIIAAINGYAVGAGFNLALACDIIIASKNAMFSEIFTKIGLIPDAGGMYFLPKLIGTFKAKELIFTGRMVNAEEAERIGIVNKVVEPEHLMQEALDFANLLLNGPLMAIGLSKVIINNSLSCSLNDLLEQEALAQGMCLMSQDFKEGVEAFKEKRVPKFNGGIQ